PGADVQLHEGRPAGRAGERVAHAGRHALVQAQDELELRVLLQQVHERLLGGARVAEDVADAVGDELLHERPLAAHLGHRLSPTPGRRYRRPGQGSIGTRTPGTGSAPPASGAAGEVQGGGLAPTRTPAGAAAGTA